jgi:hypothetical protein
MFPKEIFKEIVLQAKEEWPDDKDMQKHFISEEKEAYIKLQELEFDDLAEMKDGFIDSAIEIYDSWDSIFDYVESELVAFRALERFSVDGHRSRYD